MSERPKSPAERLDAIIRHVFPALADEHARSGRWSPVAPTEPGDADGSRLTGAVTPGAGMEGAPYVIQTLSDGRRRVRVVTQDGDVVAGTGATIGDAIAALEAKLGIKE